MRFRIRPDDDNTPRGSIQPPMVYVKTAWGYNTVQQGGQPDEDQLNELGRAGTGHGDDEQRHNVFVL